jgi:arginyl-tRNA synthetase
VTLLAHPSELALIRKLLELEEQIEMAVEKLSPHNLTHYAVELAKFFNAFYRDCKVVDAHHPSVQRRPAPSQPGSARRPGENSLTLMGISAPTSM